MFHNFSDAKAISSFVFEVGLNCMILKHTVEFTTFRYFILNRESGESFLVFSVGQYYLGINAIKGADIDALISDIALFLKKIAGPVVK
jgi:hypothetical protein